VLEPIRHQLRDFFILDLADVTPRDEMASMEHPLFGLTPTPAKRVLNYQNGEHRMRIIPSAEGVPSVHDKDVLIYCFSQLVERKNRGEPIGKHVAFHAYDLLRSVNRATGGSQYDILLSALRRMRGTTYEMTIKTNEIELTKGMALIDSYTILRTEPVTGRMVMAGVTLSDWVVRAVEAYEVLTLHPDYFRLRRPLDRRLYELGRKFCGKQEMTQMGLEKLRLRLGSKTSSRELRRVVKETAISNHLPEYGLRLDGDVLTFSRKAETILEDKRKAELTKVFDAKGRTFLSVEGREAARPYAPGWDMDWLQTRFFEWRSSAGLPTPDNWNHAFVGWVKSFCKGGTPQAAGQRLNSGVRDNDD
jgi:plasmid replication initiation protein